ncbi:MAG: hypothetical protein WCL00_05490 [Bacteroidota bacterium]
MVAISISKPARSFFLLLSIFSGFFFSGCSKVSNDVSASNEVLINKAIGTYPGTYSYSHYGYDTAYPATATVTKYSSTQVKVVVTHSKDTLLAGNGHVSDGGDGRVFFSCDHPWDPGCFTDGYFQGDVSGKKLSVQEGGSGYKDFFYHTKP